MLIDIDALWRKYPMKVTGVLHVGAHFAEEARDYERHKIDTVYWIEANPDLIPTIETAIKPHRGHRVIEALVYDEDGVELTFNVTNNERGMSSSILPLGSHARVAPQVKYVERKELRTKTIDTLAAEHGIAGVNWLVADLQGAEMHMLRGAQRFLTGIDYFMSEINVDELYVGCARLWEMDEWLGDRGFLRVETCMAENHVGWGDALWIRHPRS